MTDRILDVSEGAARLRVDTANLVVERDGQEPARVPLEDIAAVVLGNPQISLTNPVLAGLASHGAVVVACNEKRVPVGFMLPYEGHTIQARRMALQVRASVPTRKRLWQQIVREKIRGQGRILREFTGSDHGLHALSAAVRSGDTENLEAQAAQRYWPLLFPDGAFRRVREADDQNRLLNYGYVVLRAAVARGICAAGLHPSFGLHHHSKYDAFALVDDLIEPYRIVVDRVVKQLVQAEGARAPLSSEIKRAIVGAVLGSVMVGEERRSIPSLIQRSASSLAFVFEGRSNKLFLPEV